MEGSQHVARDPAAILRDDVFRAGIVRRARSGFNLGLELRQSLLVSGGSPLQRSADLPPPGFLVIAPGGGEGLVDGRGDEPDDLRVAHRDPGRRARPLPRARAHGVAGSPGAEASGGRGSGYQSCSGARPAARNPSRARSVMSLRSRNSKRGSRT